MVADIRARRAGGASLRAIAAATDVSTFSVQRALAELPAEPIPAPGAQAPSRVVPVLPDPAARTRERTAARRGRLVAAPPVFAPAARVPLAGLLLAMPGLLPCAATVFGGLPNGFYGLETMLTEAVLRTLAGQPRAEGATRVDPVALGRVLGLDRAPEVETIRRKITTGIAEQSRPAPGSGGRSCHRASYPQEPRRRAACATQ